MKRNNLCIDFTVAKNDFFCFSPAFLRPKSLDLLHRKRTSVLLPFRWTFHFECGLRDSMFIWLLKKNLRIHGRRKTFLSKNVYNWGSDNEIFILRSEFCETSIWKLTYCQYWVRMNVMFLFNPDRTHCSRWYQRALDFPGGSQSMGPAVETKFKTRLEKTEYPITLW